MKVTTDDLLDALREAMAKPGGDGATVVELTVATGYSADKVRKMLGVLKGEGRLEIVQVRRETLDGKLQAVPGYRVKGEK